MRGGLLETYFNSSAPAWQNNYHPIGFKQASKALLFILLVILFPLFTNAESAVTEVVVRSKQDPESAVGLLISQSGTIQKSKTTLKKDASGNTLVTFEVEKKEVTPSTLASAIVKNTDGTYSYGEITVLKAPTSKQNLVQCKDTDRVPQSLASQLGLLQALVQKRADRRSIAAEKVKLMLTDSLIIKLSKLEEGFGIKEPTPLSTELSPFELIDRLSRLEAAIRTHKVNSTLRPQTEIQAQTDKQ